MLTNNSPKDELISYWKDNRHAYVCCSKVGSEVIRLLGAESIDMPHIYDGRNRIKEQREIAHHPVPKFLDESIEETAKRKMLFVARCPFHRAISSYRYLNRIRFAWVRKIYLYKQIDILKMNIVEYFRFLKEEIQNDQYNLIIEHSYPQKKSLERNVIEGTNIDLLWQTEKINELIGTWNEALCLDIDVNIRYNVNIRNKEDYTKYYLEHPELFDLIKEVFSEDLEWLNPFFNYESKFTKLINRKTQ